MAGGIIGGIGGILSLSAARRGAGIGVAGAASKRNVNGVIEEGGVKAAQISGGNIKHRGMAHRAGVTMVAAAA